MAPGTAECRGPSQSLHLLAFSSLPRKQQISFIMPISGVLVNVHDPDYVLATHKDGVHVKVEGQQFTLTDNQRVSRRPEIKFRP